MGDVMWLVVRWLGVDFGLALRLVFRRFLGVDRGGRLHGRHEGRRRGCYRRGGQHRRRRSGGRARHGGRCWAGARTTLCLGAVLVPLSAKRAHPPPPPSLPTKPPVSCFEYHYRVSWHRARLPHNRGKRNMALRTVGVYCCRQRVSFSTPVGGCVHVSEPNESSSFRYFITQPSFLPSFLLQLSVLTRNKKDTQKAIYRSTASSRPSSRRLFYRCRPCRSGAGTPRCT